MNKNYFLIIVAVFININVSTAQYHTYQKPNDYLVAKFTYPRSGAANMIYNDMTTDNTQFLSKQEYRNTPFVKKKFTFNGVFDEQMWSQFYSLLSDEWYRFCNWSYRANAELEVIYSETSRNQPIDVKVIYCNGCAFWKKYQ